MSTTYSYTIPNIKFLEHLHTYILNIPGLSQDFYLYNEGTINIIFKNALSNDNLITLNNAIVSYIAPQELIKFTTSQNINLFNDKVDSMMYSLIGVYLYSSNISDGNILNTISFVSNISNSIATYKIKVYDTTNNNIITESDDLNNTTLQLFTLNNISNLPKTNSLFEIQAKVNGNSSYCNIKTCAFNFAQILN